MIDVKCSAHRLAEAKSSMARWRNGLADDGPSGAARAIEFDRAAEAAIAEIEHLREALAKIATMPPAGAYLSGQIARDALDTTEG